MWHWLCAYKAYKNCNRFRRVAKFLYSSWLYCCKSVFISCFFWDNWTCNASNSSYSKQGSITCKLQVCLVYSAVCVLLYYVHYHKEILKYWELMHLVPESCDTFSLNIAVFRFRSELWGYKTFWMHLIQQKNILKMTNYSMLTSLARMVFPRWQPI